MQGNNTTGTERYFTLDSRLAVRIPVETLDHARHVGLQLQCTVMERRSYVLGVTSALPGEGKTTLSAALADVMAADFGFKVMLLDMHAERPWPLSSIEPAVRQGFGAWLTDDCGLAEMVLEIHDNYSIIPFGSQKLSSRNLLQGMVRRDALQTLREQANLVIADLPELTNPTAPALANLCDGIVLVMRAGQTPSEAVKQFLPVLQNVTVHGVVLNCYTSAMPGMLRRLLS